MTPQPLLVPSLNAEIERLTGIIDEIRSTAAEDYRGLIDLGAIDRIIAATEVRR